MPNRNRRKNRQPSLHQQCENGSAIAAYNLGNSYIEAKEGKHNEFIAEYYYKLTLRNGNKTIKASALNKLRKIYKSRGDVLFQNNKKLWPGLQ